MSETDYLAKIDERVAVLENHVCRLMGVMDRLSTIIKKRTGVDLYETVRSQASPSAEAEYEATMG